MATVWVGIVEHKHGKNIYAAPTQEALDKLVFTEYVKDEWSSFFDDPCPDDPTEALATYFVPGHPFSEEYYSAKEVEIVE